MRKVRGRKVPAFFDDDEGIEESYSPTDYWLAVQSLSKNLNFLRKAASRNIPPRRFRHRYGKAIDDVGRYLDIAESSPKGAEEIKSLIGGINEAYARCALNSSHVRVDDLVDKCDSDTIVFAHKIIQTCFDSLGLVPYDADPIVLFGSKSNSAKFSGDLWVEYAIFRLFDSSITVSNRKSLFSVDIEGKDTLKTNKINEVVSYFGEYLENSDIDNLPYVRRLDGRGQICHTNLKKDLSKLVV